MEKRIRTRGRCAWIGCDRRSWGRTSLCPHHHHQAKEEYAEELRRSPLRATSCVMPGCHKLTSDLPHLRLCNAHLAIVAEQVNAAANESNPLVLDDVPVDPDEYLLAHERKEALPKPRRKPKPVIYYVKISDYIKIGWTSDLQSRMRSYPPNSVLLAVHPGSRADETKLHKRFAAHRTHGREWYAPVPTVLHHIEQMKAQHGEPEQVTFGAQPVTIPEPRPVEYIAMRARSGAHYRRTSA